MCIDPVRVRVGADKLVLCQKEQDIVVNHEADSMIPLKQIEQGVDRKTLGLHPDADT